MAPADLPDLFKGEQLVVFGRYAGSGDDAITLEGTINGKHRFFTYEKAFAAKNTDYPFIPRLWATRRVGYLLDEIRLRGESKELKDEVTELARKFNIVTPYTAFLILEDEGRRGLAQDVRTLNARGAEEREQLSFGYDSLKRDRSGSLAVSGARSALRLKSAEAPAAALEADRNEGFLGLAMSAPAPAAGRPYAAAAAGQSMAASKPIAQAARERADDYARQSRYVGGRTFYLNESQWVDSEVQKLTNPQRLRVQFGSADYFDLLKKHPEATPWVSVGRNVTFVLGGVVYEIYE
jgi:Ca-activated chloride channel family protein